jgi:uncharacterized membrane protein
MFRKSSIITTFVLFALLAITILPVAAQEATPTPVPVPLSISTAYPSQVIGLGETVSLNMTLHTTTAPQVVKLEVKGLPEGWTTSFRGGGRVVNSVFVNIDKDGTVDLRVEPPADAKAGTFKFTVVATGDGTKAELPLELTIKEKLPPKLTLESDLPTLRGTPSTTFRYSVSLKNDGDTDLTVNLSAETSPNFIVSFNLNGQDVIDVPMAAQETKGLSVVAKPVGNVEAGDYKFDMLAQGGDVQATIQLVAEVTGQPSLTITTQSGNLSGTAYAGRDTPLKFIIQNNGTAPARGVEVSSSESTGWSVTFTPNKITEIPSGQQVEVTANIRPAEKAVAGDYMVSVTAKSTEGLSQSTDFRITVRTSTLWGVVGIVLVAVAVGVVALAVMRFGRR